MEDHDELEESNVLQGQFTRYLIKSVRNTKINFIRKMMGICDYEILTEIEEFDIQGKENDGLELDGFFVIEQIDDDKLFRAVKSLTDREFKILTMKVLDGYSYLEIGKEFGIGYKTAASLYYRVIQKLKIKMKEEE